MSNRLWGILAALAATVQSTAANAQSKPLESWAVTGGWTINRGAVGCGASHDRDPFFLFSQTLDGGVLVGMRAPGGSFRSGDAVTLQFRGTDPAGQPLADTYSGTASDPTSGTLVALSTTGNMAADSARADRIVVSGGDNRGLQPVVLPDYAYATRAVRRCLTELRRIDRGSGRPAETRPVLLNPRSPLVSPEDYPPAAAREEAQGVTLVALTISAKGLISNCRVKTSSGRLDLDEQTCQSLSRRARYTPALDAQGNPTEGETTQPIRWQLPRD